MRQNIRRIIDFDMRCAAIAICLVVASTAVAQDNSADQPSAEEVAANLANPNTPLASLTLKLQFRTFEGNLPNAETTIRVEGRLGGEAVPELRREFQRAGGSARLDLSGLMSADADGVRELLKLSAEGIELCGASAYIRLDTPWHVTAIHK